MYDIMNTLLKETFFNEGYEDYQSQLDENNLYLFVEVPGYTRKQLEVALDGNVLTINSKLEKENTNNFSYRKRIKKLSFRLSNNLNAEAADAKVEDGILTITIPKKEKINTKRLLLE